MGCGCGGKAWPEQGGQKQGGEAAQPSGSANPDYTWPPKRGNGPAPKGS